MSFIDDSEKNVSKAVLKEVSAGAGVGGFTGRAGMGIDALFAGPFHPDSGNGSQIEKLLKQQIEDRKKKIKDTDSFEPNPLGGWYDIDTESNRLGYEELLAKMELVKQFNIDNTPEQDLEWKSTGVNIDFDDIYTHIDNEEDFINTSEINMELVGIDIKYDDEPEYAGEDFINKSKTNWKLVGRK
jgi:hypothetical protein